MKGEPFKVTWELHAPVIVPSMPIHLDALLSWARVHEATLAGDRDALERQHDLPLKKHQTESGWCFMASVVRFDFMGPMQQLHMTKRADLDALARSYQSGVFGTRKPYFDASRGMTKGASLQLPQAFASSAWACGVGDLEEVRALLGQVRALGKLARRGKGAIRSFKVEPWVEAETAWVQRNLPADSEYANVETHALAQQRLHAPYWSKEQHVVMAPIGF